MIDFRFSGSSSLRCVNFNNIKSGLQRRRVLGKVHGCGDPDSILLPMINIFPRFGKVSRFSQFHFHKYQVLFVSDDQIDLSETAPITGRYNFIPLFSQVFRCQRFSPGTQKIISPHKTFSESSSGEWENDRDCAEPRSVLWCRSPYVHQNCTPGTFPPFPA